jgi:hypothetical protein
MKTLIQSQILILPLFAILFFSSCVSSGYEEYEEAQKKAENEFNTNIYPDQKKIIDKYFQGNLKYDWENDSLEIQGGFYCLFEHRGKEIYPHMELNQLFYDAGYYITNSGSQLNYIIVVYNIPHNVGTYTNGGQANQMETKISIIDLKKECVYPLEGIMGSAPPNTISKKIGDNSGSIGSVATNEEIFNLISSELQFSK